MINSLKINEGPDRWRFHLFSSGFWGESESLFPPWRKVAKIGTYLPFSLPFAKHTRNIITIPPLFTRRRLLPALNACMLRLKLALFSFWFWQLRVWFRYLQHTVLYGLSYYAVFVVDYRVLCGIRKIGLVILFEESCVGRVFRSAWGERWGVRMPGWGFGRRRTLYYSFEAFHIIFINQ